MRNAVAAASAAYTPFGPGQQFHRHDGRGDRRVRGGGEHRHETHRGQERRRHAEERRQRGAARGADEENRRHDAAAAAGFKRDRRRQDLEEKCAGEDRRRARQHAVDRVGPETGVGVAGGQIQEHQRHAARSGQQVRPAFEATQRALEKTQRLDEQ